MKLCSRRTIGFSRIKTAAVIHKQIRFCLLLAFTGRDSFDPEMRLFCDFLRCGVALLQGNETTRIGIKALEAKNSS